ncbi:MAG: ATP-binding cassette domain-containing protein [Candidatus Eisenbacteria bacterium]
MNAQALVTMADIVKQYEVGEEVVHALAGVSFEIRSDEYVAIMGPSGSGKSTLMNLIGCLDATSGQYRLRGQAVQDLDEDALATVRNWEVGFVFQTFNLLPAPRRPRTSSSLSSTQEWLAAARKPRVAEALARVGLSDRSHHRPNQLSGGRRQRGHRPCARDPSPVWWRTNRPATWTPRPGTRSSPRSTRSIGPVPVSSSAHEEDVAQRAGASCACGTGGSRSIRL